MNDVHLETGTKRRSEMAGKRRCSGGMTNVPVRYPPEKIKFGTS